MPNLRDWTCADPTIIPGTAVHVNMVIQPQSFRMFPFLFIGELKQVAEIAVAERENNVLRRADATVVERPDFVEYHPHLWHGGGIAPVRLADQLTLIVEELIEQIAVAVEIRVRVKRKITVTAQPDCRKIIESCVALQPLQPELFHVIGVFSVIPFAKLTAALCPFLLIAHQRFVVAGSHDYAIFIGNDWVHGVVLVESLAPHCRPQIIALQA